MNGHSAAGKGTPYWYEWTVGLLRVVQMAYPDSGVLSVTFQETGIKGWDDVVVRYNGGQTEYIQVKHSREGKNITLGSFLTEDEQGRCLLSALYAAWLEMDLCSDSASCIIFTNREAGQRTYQGRPPLLEFTGWLSEESQGRTSIEDFDVPEGWDTAWQEWISRLNSGTEVQRLDFLRAMRVEVNQPDLEELQSEVLKELARAFGTSEARALPLLHALSDALKRWTDKHEKVTPEDLYSVLVLPSELERPNLAPPPPTPFFPTRETEAAFVEAQLVNPDTPQVVFLSAPPGAGKTSLLSRIELRRSDQSLSGIVGLRYFAFRPITPGTKEASLDTDYFVNPTRMWFSLLSQLRTELNGRLRHYSVPVRNALLDWQEAREHVLRLADRIGAELGRKFVIAIDGIDHAARAGRLRYDPTIAVDFFSSLPGPIELEGRNIRLLLAGQPAENYSEYPTWLKTPRDDVQLYNLNPLRTNDIAVLFRSADLRMPNSEWETAVTTIASAVGGNTLAVVFAIEEAGSCDSAAELSERLQSRRLHDGLQAYYESIWRYALSKIREERNCTIGLEEALAGALCVLEEPVSGEILESAFDSIDLSADQWSLALDNLGPLIVPKGSGYRVLHNDVRVFLGAHLSSNPPATHEWISSCLANHYLKPSSNRRAAHRSLFSLLTAARRTGERARAFSVHWVFEACSLGISFTAVSEQCKVALRSALELQDWEVVHELACAVETLERWENSRHSIPNAMDCVSVSDSPHFPPSELTVKPLEIWTCEEIFQVVRDAKLIIDSGERGRGYALLHRWFDGLTLDQVAERVYPEEDEDNEHQAKAGEREDDLFRSLGSVARGASFYFEFDPTEQSNSKRAEYFFEKGWVERSCADGPYQCLAACFSGDVPRFLANIESGIRELADQGHWRLVGRLLRLSHDSSLEFPVEFRYHATWLCIKAGVQDRCPDWFSPARNDSSGQYAVDERTGISQVVAICRARGWIDPVGDSSAIACDVRRRILRGATPVKNPGHTLLILRSGVILGQLASLQSQQKTETARTVLRPSEVADILSALWNEDLHRSFDTHSHATVAGRLALELVEAFFPLSSTHATALTEAVEAIARPQPRDNRLKSVWHVHRLVGNRRFLCDWLSNVLGENGEIWNESPDSREETVSEFLELARAIGEESIVDRAMARASWSRIGYRCQKDYSFGHIYYFFEALSKLEPTVVRDFGSRIAGLCEICDTQGGENRWWFDLCGVLGAAAISAGPQYVWELLLRERVNCGSDSWLEETRQLFLGGFQRFLAWEADMPPDDKLCCWCVAIALTRWFEPEEVKGIEALRTSLLASVDSDDHKTQLTDMLARISPGEAIREAERADDDDEQDPDSQSATIDDWEHDLEEGRRLTPARALAAVRQITQDQGFGDGERIATILKSFGVSQTLSGSWGGFEESTQHILVDILNSLPDRLHWHLADAALHRLEEVDYWWPAVHENLHSLVLARSRTCGAQRLKGDIDRLLAMHERWALGGEQVRSVPQRASNLEPTISTWPRFSEKLFVELLTSRFATVIESTLVGVNAFIEVDPSRIQGFIKSVGTDSWKARWALTAAEVWALKHPHELSVAMSSIERLGTEGQLSTRLQAWIVQLLLARRLSEEPPSFCYRANGHSNSALKLVTLGDILHTEAEVSGSFRIVDRFRSARSAIERAETTTGMDFSDVKASVGPKLIETSERELSERSWKETIRNRDDSLSRGEDAWAALDEEIDDALAMRIPSAPMLIRFSQAYLNSEEGWILSQTPTPHPAIDDWPTEDALAGEYHKPLPTAKMVPIIRRLAVELGVNSDEYVIAACLRAYSWREDLTYYCWYQECGGPPDLNPQIPSTLSGRTFPWFFPEAWWEPPRPEGARTLCFRTGGQQTLLCCYPYVVPSRVWLDAFGWQPAETNPLSWVQGEDEVARFELLHGPPPKYGLGAARRPELHRWVAKRSAFESVMEKLPKLQWLEDFDRVPSKKE